MNSNLSDEVLAEIRRQAREAGPLPPEVVAKVVPLLRSGVEAARIRAEQAAKAS